MNPSLLQQPFFQVTIPLMVRSCEKIGRRRPGQAKPPAPPLTAHNLHWWRRRFRLRILIFSQLLTFVATVWSGQLVAE